MDLYGFGFSCKCKSLWTGSTCQTQIDPCLLNPCINGACVSVSGNASYLCNCQIGYTGQNCNFIVNDCSSNPCLNSGNPYSGHSKFT